MLSNLPDAGEKEKILVKVKRFLSIFFSLSFYERCVHKLAPLASAALLIFTLKSGCLDVPLGFRKLFMPFSQSKLILVLFDR